MRKRPKPKRFPFSKSRLKSLETPSQSRIYVYDSKVPSLAMCVTNTGTKTFYLYRKVQGRPERIRLGIFGDLSVEQAQDEARKLIGDIARGADVVQERKARRNVPTLSIAFERWGKLHASIHRRSWKEDQRVYKKYLARFHSRQLNRITASDVAAWHGDVGEHHGRVQANRALTLLRTVYNYHAKTLGYEGKNPTLNVKKFPEQSRERFLQPAEIKRFFASLARQPQPWRDFFAVLLFCGARKSNAMAMRWDDVDLDGMTWRIPAPKNGTPTTLPLTPAVVRILVDRLVERNESPYVFPGRAGHLRDPQDAWQSLLRDAEIADLHIHDLRRSLASWQAALGTSLQIVGASLGHQDMRATQVYSRLQLDPIRQSVNQAVGEMMRVGGYLEAETIEIKPAGADDGEETET